MQSTKLYSTHILLQTELGNHQHSHMQGMVWEALLRHTVERQAFLSPEVAINLTLKTENAGYMGWL